jgi:C1A family cysteine protease
LTTTHTRMHVRRGYGWRPSKPDFRDVPLEIPIAALAHPLPSSVDLRKTGFLDFPIYDQLELGACTANAIAAALRFCQVREGLPALDPARLFIYWSERDLEGTTGVDGGAELRDGLKVVATTGYPDEALWPYDIVRFADRPSDAAFSAAAKDHVTSYYRVATTADSLKRALALGYPVCVGFTVYESFEGPDVAQHGAVPIPGLGESVIGGHAVLCVGYDDDHGEWACRNSWGESWGDGGYFYLPYGYLNSSSYAGDFWTIRQEVEG